MHHYYSQATNAEKAAQRIRAICPKLHSSQVAELLLLPDPRVASLSASAVGGGWESRLTVAADWLALRSRRASNLEIPTESHMCAPQEEGLPGLPHPPGPWENSGPGQNSRGEGGRG